MKPSLDDERSEDGTEAVLVSEVIPATRERVFTAWLNSEQHSAFTGDHAVIEPVVGGKHSSLSGYASGTTLALDPYRRIVQSWRAREFPAGSGPSTVEITLEETVGGTLLTLLHTEIPQGQSDRCREAWLTSYLAPLKRYFTGRLSNGVHKADTQALRRKRKPTLATKPAAKATKPAPKRATKPPRKTKGKTKSKTAKAASKPVRRVAAKKQVKRTAPGKRPSARSAAAKSSKKPVSKRAGSKSRPAKRPRSR